ncbi:hypothetical protein P689_119195 [Candidatus Riesia pediculischaeffi PTSU]|uniref:Uncharacterized protein n=1 Tax=Candidatus Riesia pediculischaeffi PTSU TaxID=1401651 RepID=A0A0C1V723_9ENTR|nr:hypothetical protein P689_119195 [Candidatus Riesia pediculischaeffi PTSU]
MKNYDELKFSFDRGRNVQYLLDLISLNTLIFLTDLEIKITLLL